MKTKEVQKLINENPDWVNLKRFDFSLNKVVDRFPNGVPNRLIAQALMITEEEVEEIVTKNIMVLREFLGVEVDND